MWESPLDQFSRVPWKSGKVINTSRHVVHLHACGDGILAVCGLFRCGTPAKPLPDSFGSIAKFLPRGFETDKLDDACSLCPRCFGPKMLQRYGCSDRPCNVRKAVDENLKKVYDTSEVKTQGASSTSSESSSLESESSETP